MDKNCLASKPDKLLIYDRLLCCQRRGTERNASQAKDSCGTCFGSYFGTYFDHQADEGLLKLRSSNSCGTYFRTYFRLTGRSNSPGALPLSNLALQRTPMDKETSTGVLHAPPHCWPGLTVQRHSRPLFQIAAPSELKITKLQSSWITATKPSLARPPETVCHTGAPLL